MGQSGMSQLHLSPNYFDRKTLFSASQHLARAWSVKPPELSPKLYRSLTGPRGRRSRGGPRPAAQILDPRKRAQQSLPKFLLEINKVAEPAKVIPLRRAPDALQSQLTFVKFGKYPTRPSRNAKPHSFRPLNEDLPNIVTASWNRDPGNLNFKSKHLDIIGTRCTVSTRSSRDVKTRMDTYKPAEPRWDPGLILPKLPWPPKLASYTIHSRRREVYSAFMERVEEKLSLSWAKR